MRVYLLADPFLESFRIFYFCLFYSINREIRLFFKIHSDYFYYYYILNTIYLFFKLTVRFRQLLWCWKLNSIVTKAQASTKSMPRNEFKFTARYPRYTTTVESITSRIANCHHSLDLSPWPVEDIVVFDVAFTLCNPSVACMEASMSRGSSLYSGKTFLLKWPSPMILRMTANKPVSRRFRFR